MIESKVLKSRIIEVMIIVGSILLAFAIDSWWDSSQTRQLEHRQLQALATELNDNSIQAPLFIDYIATRASTFEEVFAYFSTSQPTNTNYTFPLILGPLGEYTPLQSALDDLFGSGGYQAIQSPTVRRTLNRYQQQINNVDEAQLSYRNFNDRFWMDFVVENYFLYDLETPLLIDNGIDLVDVDLDQNLEHLFANQTYSNIIYIELAESLIIKRELTALQDVTIALLDAIESEYEIQPE